MSALAVVRWLTLNDPDIATLATDVRLHSAAIEAARAAGEARRQTFGEPENPTTPDPPTREPAGHTPSLPDGVAQPTGCVLQPVADSPHDPNEPPATCGTCRHWDRPGPNGVYVHTYGVCAAIHQNHHDGDGYPVILDTLTGPLNGFVATTAEFACAHHEARR